MPATTLASGNNRPSAYQPDITSTAPAGLQPPGTRLLNQPRMI